MINLTIPEFKYNDVTILNNIQLELATGNTYGVVGLNGAGKTTLFKLMAGIIKSSNCNFSLDGKRLSFQEVAYVDTDLFFYPNLTAKEFLSVFPKGSSNYDEEKLAAIFKLPLDQFASEFSTGMKKKLLLMSQIKQDKSVFILDEPFNGLDLETNKLLELIISILNQRGKTVFISSHILEPLLNVCSEIHFLKDKIVSKTYSKNEFETIHDDLFGNYLEGIKNELLGAI